MNHTDEIHTTRLRLWPMSIAFLEASLANERATAEKELEATIEPEWFDEGDLMQIRRGDLIADPDARPWLLRAIVEVATRRMIGHIGCHTRPDAPYLQTFRPQAVEFGYTIFPAYRRRGFAREASLGLMEWAAARDVANFIASANPENTPSVRLLEQLGFVRIGGHIDEVDGYEDIFARPAKP